MEFYTKHLVYFWFLFLAISFILFHFPFPGNVYELCFCFVISVCIVSPIRSDVMLTVLA